MNRPERAFWDLIDRHMGPRWDAQRHEDKYSTGIPDVSFGCRGTDGWIELKALTAPPRQKTRPFNLRELSIDQRLWLDRRASKGNPWRLFVFVRFISSNEFILHRWVTLRNILGSDWNAYHESAACAWRGMIDLQQFIDVITSDPHV